MPASVGPEIERLIQLLARLPGLGPRSARRAALQLIKKREQLMSPLADAMRVAADRILVCSSCGNVDTSDPCAICADQRRDPSLIVVVEDVSDLWALERAGVANARYHVLGGTLSALDGFVKARGKGGETYMLDEHWGLNFDVKKIFLEPKVKVNNGLVSGKVKIDPWLIGAGVTYRF